MVTIDLDKLSAIKRLDPGAHSSPSVGLCLTEAVAYVCGLEHTDYPSCVSSTLIWYGRSLNDALSRDYRQQLKRYIPLMPGTYGDGLDLPREYLALDWLVRTYTSAWLELADLREEARALRELSQIDSADTARLAKPVLRMAAVAISTVVGHLFRRNTAVPACSDLCTAMQVGMAAMNGRCDDTIIRNIIENAFWIAGSFDRASFDKVSSMVSRLQQSAIDLFGRMITAGYDSGPVS